MTEGDILKKLIAESHKSIELWPLSSCTFKPNWDFSLPTFKSRRKVLYHDCWSTSEHVRNYIEEKHQLTFEVLHDLGVFHSQGKMALYGGSLLRILTRQSESVRGDYDLVWIDPEMTDEESCKRAAMAVLQTIVGTFKRLNLESRNERQRQKQHGQSEPAASEVTDTPMGQFIIPGLTTLNQFTPQSFASNEQRAKSPSKFPYMDLEKLKGLRTGNVLHIQYGHQLDIDISFRIVSSLPEFLQSCYPPCSALALYQGKVSFSSLSKYCFENLLIPFSRWQNKRSPNRIVKYFDFGFDVVFPDLDLASIPRDRLHKGDSELIELPLFLIEIHSIANNIVEVNRFDAHPRCDRFGLAKESKFNQNWLQANFYHMVSDRVNHEKEDKSNRLSSDDFNNDNVSAGRDDSHNVKVLIAGQYNAFIYSGYGDKIVSVLDRIPSLSDRTITEVYEHVLDQLKSSKGSRTDLLLKYFDCRPAAKILEDILIGPVKEAEKLMKNSTKRTDQSKETEASNSDVVAFERKRGVRTSYDDFVDKYFEELVVEQVGVLSGEVERVTDIMTEGDLGGILNERDDSVVVTMAEALGKYYLKPQVETE